MTFFSYFPNTVISKDNSPILIQDFLQRVSITSAFRDNVVLMDDYFIEDGESPEMVSYKVYETPLYHWIIFLVNDITDPREEWPMTDRMVSEYVFMNYDFVISVPNASLYDVDDVVTSNSGGNFLVTSTNNTTNKVSLRSQKGTTYITNSSILTNVTSDTTNLTVTSVIDPTEGVHHYFDTELNYIVDNDITNPNIIAVTNYEYEVNRNDAKRTIKILNERFISEIEKEFRDKIGA